MTARPAFDMYVETHALLAVMDGDDAKLDELLDDLLPGELRTLAGCCHKLGMAAETAADEKDRT